MQNEKTEREFQGSGPAGGTEREYPGDTGRSHPRSDDTPGRVQDTTSVRPKDNEPTARPDIERGSGSQHQGDEIDATDGDTREPRDKDEAA